MNKTDNLNNQQLHSYARLLAAEAAIAAGVPETALMILAGTVEVHARRSGSWQVSLPGAAPGTAAVVFADMSGKQLQFYMVPAGPLRDGVMSRHAEAYPDGHRVNNDDSPHAAVELEHIEKWGTDWRAYARTELAEASQQPVGGPGAITLTE
jgi:hypothetical protein